MKNLSAKAIVTAATIGMIPQMSVAGDMATGAEIKAYLSGNTLQGSTGTDPFAEYYDADGTIRGDGYSAKWKVEGDTGCMDYGNGFGCWTAIIHEEGAIWIKEGEADAASMLLQGNPNNY